MQTISFLKQAQHRYKADQEYQRKSGKQAARKNRDKLNATQENMSVNHSLLFNANEQIDGLSMRFSVCPSELPFITETCS